MRHKAEICANNALVTKAAEFIMGHAGGNRVADGYGQGRVVPRRSDGKPMALAIRLEEMEKIIFPSLPLRPER